MRRDRRKISRKGAERLLGAGSARPEGGVVESRHLAALLAASSAPARAGEQDGEEAAVAAFRESSPGTRAAGATHPRGLPLARLFSAKIAAVAMAATAAGGIALASATDTLPLVSSSPKERPSRGLPVAPSASPRQPPFGAPGNPSAIPEPQQVRLCQAYQSATKTDPGKAQQDPAFGPLRSAAGGHGQVIGYCTRVLAAAPGPHPTPTPGHGRPEDPGKPKKPGNQGNPKPPGRPNEPGKSKQPGHPGDHGKAGDHGKPKAPGEPPGKAGKPKPATPVG